jgi:hypothetical protein
MHQWPAHLLSADDTDRISFNGTVDEAPKHTPIRFVYPRGMNDHGLDTAGIEDAAQMRDHPSERRKRIKRRLFRGDVVTRRAQHALQVGPVITEKGRAKAGSICNAFGNRKPCQLRPMSAPEMRARPRP